MNRKEAAAAGLERYIPGKPCRRGHICERYVRNGSCCECVALHNKSMLGKHRIRPSPQTANGLRGDAARAGLKHYFTGIPCKNGHIAKRYVVTRTCMECGRANGAAWKKDNPERSIELGRASYRRNPKKRYESYKKWRKANLLHSRQLIAGWRKRHPGAINALNKRRKADKLKRTPAWADLPKIKKIYEHCPAGYHVDHIYPLLGETVSGLHVENNLQYLLAIENLRKRNSLPTESC